MNFTYMWNICVSLPCLICTCGTDGLVNTGYEGREVWRPATRGHAGCQAAPAECAGRAAGSAAREAGTVGQ